MFGTVIAWIFNSTIGHYLVGAVAVALVGSLVWGGCERSARIKAQDEAQLFKTAAGISQEQLKGAQERAEITAKATKKRGQINEWERQGDLDSLSGDFNAIGGVRRSGVAGPKGGPGAPGRNQYSDGAGTQYQEAP